ncbi:unnamed protein product [Dracunculus medinensis]|uniref:valine--tRNA ligase n=1 Tax=Dracunculus medinensis TaxID=318479 RepID=A0A3P7QAE7_DRAME|nr:unnamed protein product [Dracunculus medinensis]
MIHHCFFVSRDWCISRQLWWGHRIPSYFVTVDDEKIPPGNADDNNYWISAHTETEAIEKAAKRFGVPREKISLKWDEDVLDTWFSSGIWPFSIFGWPDQTSDLKQFFPSSVLETGHDILFFWVARMVFLSQELTGQLPFKEVFLHAVIRDAHGRKMSKSLGNVVDPIDVIHGISLDDLNKKLEFGNLDERYELEKAREGQSRDYPHGIPECGTDAVRFALISYTSQSRDINLDVLRVQGYRFFCNKIWQAVRFTLMQLDIDFKPLDPFQLLKCSSLLDKWILSRLSATIEACQSGLSSYNFHVAANALYRFWLYDFCDIFIEGSKPILLQSESGSSLAVQFVLYECVDTALRLLAPFMPFITEELWQRFVRKPSNMNVPSICVAEYPQVSQYPYRNEELELRILKAMEIVKTVRSLRSDYGLTPKIKTDLYIFYELDSVDISDLSSFIGTLASSNKVIILEAEGVSQIPNGCAQVTVSAKCKIALALEGIIDMGKELNKLYIKRNKLLEQLRKLEEQTTMVDYLDRVPLNIRVNNAEKVDAYKSEIAHLNEAINALENSK